MKVIEIIDKIKDLELNIEELKSMKADIRTDRYYSNELIQFIDDKIKEMTSEKKNALNLKVDISSGSKTNDMSVLSLQDTKNKVKNSKEYENKKKIIYHY